MQQPTIISAYEGGAHNADLARTVARLDKQAQWRELSTIIITPCSNAVPVRVVASWEAMMTPPNNKTTRMYPRGMEVGHAYSTCIEAILAHPELGKWKYILTREHDNTLPADGMVRLLERMENHPEMTAIGGLYFTKGIGGAAQIWGDPNSHPVNFRPQKPAIDGSLVECCGLGMGFTLFRLEAFRDTRLRRPWFKTTSSKEEGAFSQDLYFWHDARKYGHRCAVDCSVRVGHLDEKEDMVW